MGADATEPKSKIKPTQVVAAALASLTAAFLGSTLGVYGTVIGAGLVSILTTVGGEFYLRSLDRTAQAAKRTRAVAIGRSARPLGTPTHAAETVPFGVPFRTHARMSYRPEVAQSPRARRMTLRWPLVAGVSLAAFALGMLVITGIEGLTGTTLSGGQGSTIGKVVAGGGMGPAQEVPADAESESEESAEPAVDVTTSTVVEPSEVVTPSETVAPEESRDTGTTTSTEEPSESSAPATTSSLVPSVRP